MRTPTIRTGTFWRVTVKTADQMLEEGEDVTVRVISISELIKNAQTAQMTDAVAVLYAYEELKQLIVQK